MDARTALLGRLFDHAPMFPPASMPLADAVAEDERAQASPDAWLLGRFVVPEGTEVDGRELAIVAGGRERQGDVTYVEGVSKIRCGGAVIPSAEELAGFVRRCRAQGIVFKATAGLHHAYPTAAGEHGFLNLLAAAVFGEEEAALRAPHGAFELDADSFRWGERRAGADELSDVRRTLLHSIGSCSFFEPVGELHELGIL
ncbi:MAG: hypothetical protein JOY72_06795 [Actinobacteria bacterium]|nr:hypothetical protein [Actinomycetota bacterium]